MICGLFVSNNNNIETSKLIFIPFSKTVNVGRIIHLNLHKVLNSY